MPRPVCRIHAVHLAPFPVQPLPALKPAKLFDPERTMSGTTTATTWDAEAFEQFLASRQEPPWLLEKRRECFEQFRQMAWPRSDEEEWRRTDIRTFHLERFPLPGQQPPEPKEQLPQPLLAQGVPLAGQVITSNARLIHCDLADSAQAQQVVFGSLEQWAAKCPAVQEHFGKVVSLDYDRFAALHGAFWNGGTVLYVPPGVKVQEAFHVYNTLGSTPGSDFAHLLVVLDQGAEATVLLENAGGEQGGLHCGAIEVVVGPEATLRLVSLQNWSPKLWHFAHHRAVVHQHGRLQWTIGALGARLAKVNQHVALCGQGAWAQVNGVMFTQARQHLSYHTLQHHQVPACTSDLLYKAALQDQSRVVWRGMIRVEPGAVKTNGYQRNDNLMLSDQARADSIPGLEIEADDVICTHGSTTGHVDDEQIFYAQTRGLSRKEATQVIVTGFFQQVFDRIPLPSVAEALGGAIRRRVRHYA